MSMVIRFSPTTAIGSPRRRPCFSALVAIGSSHYVGGAAVVAEPSA